MTATANYTIRRAVPDDVETLREVHHAAIRAKAVAHYTPEQIARWTPPATPQRQERSRQELANEQMIAFVAETSEALIGFSMVIPATGELRAVYAAPNAIGGVGSALLAKAEAAAAKAGAQTLTCDASLNAESFYRKHGYSVIRHKMHVSEDGMNAPCIEMTKRLNMSAPPPASRPCTLTLAVEN